MTKMIQNQLSKAALNERRVFYTLLGLIVVASSFYGFFVKQAIVNVVEREKILKETRTLSSTVGDLESKYMAQKNGITLEYAYAQGFQDAGETTYITRKALTANIAYVSNAY